MHSGCAGNEDKLTRSADTHCTAWHRQQLCGGVVAGHAVCWPCIGRHEGCPRQSPPPTGMCARMGAYICFGRRTTAAWGPNVATRAHIPTHCNNSTMSLHSQTPHTRRSAPCMVLLATHVLASKTIDNIHRPLGEAKHENDKGVTGRWAPT